MRIGDDEAELHRLFGVELNNRMWEQVDNAELTPEADEHVRQEAIYRAFASAYHWRQVGNPLNWGRAEHLISRTAVAVGEYPLSLQHAERYLNLIAQHPDLAEDFDYAFAYEALARALAANGRIEEGRKALEEARARAEMIAEEEDRQIVDSELARGPWFGLDD